MLEKTWDEVLQAQCHKMDNENANNFYHKPNTQFHMDLRQIVLMKVSNRNKFKPNTIDQCLRTLRTEKTS